MNDFLQAEEEDNTSAGGISHICDFYAYPVATYYSKKDADRQYVYEDVRRYRSKYRPDRWAIDRSKTEIRKGGDGSYSIELYGDYSYYIRKPKVPPGNRERYIHNHYELNGNYKITSVYEVK